MVFKNGVRNMQAILTQLEEMFLNRTARRKQNPYTIFILFSLNFWVTLHHTMSDHCNLPGVNINLQFLLCFTW